MTLLDTLEPALQGLARQLTADPDLRQDVLQEMRLALWLAATQQPGQTSAWYLQHCRHRAIDALRRGKSLDSKARPGSTRLHGTALPSAPPDTAPQQAELRDLLERLAQRCTAQQRHVLSGRAAGLSQHEIGQRTRLSQQAVSLQWRRVQALAAQLVHDAL